MSEEKSDQHNELTKVPTEETDEAGELPQSENKAPSFIERLILDLQDGIDEAWQAAQPKAMQLLRKGRHTQVRLSYKGREFARLSVLAFLAAEAVAVLRISLPAALMVNIAGKIFLTVDFVDEVGELAQRAEEHAEAGEFDEALKLFDAALELDSHRAPVHIKRGKVLQKKGAEQEALAAFQKALELDPQGEAGAEARELLGDNSTEGEA